MTIKYTEQENKILKEIAKILYHEAVPYEHIDRTAYEIFDLCKDHFWTGSSSKQ